MTRNLKALGLTLVAVLALTAIAASAASAEPPNDAKLTLDEYPATITGTQTEPEDNELVLPGNRSVRCEEIKYNGEYTEAEAEAGEATATPEYEGCTSTILGNVTPTTVTTNGCSLTLTFGTYIDETHSSATNTAHVTCPTGKEIEIHVWQTEAKHLNNETPICTYGVPAQTVEETVNFTISGDMEHPHTFLTITGEDLPIAVKRLSGTLTNCGAASQTGEITAKAKVEALNGDEEMLEATFSQEEE